MTENEAQPEPQDDSDLTSLSDEELHAASGGKASNGDQVVIVETGKDQAAIF